MLQEADLGHTIRFIAEMPPHVCINELVITPTFSRSYIGQQEIRQATKDTQVHWCGAPLG